MMSRTLTYNGKQLNLLITNKGTSATGNVYEVAVDMMGNNILFKNGNIVDQTFVYYKNIYEYIKRTEKGEVIWDYTVQ